MALDKFRAAPLPNPPAQYDSQYMRQVIRVLEVYFNQLDSNTPNNAQKYTADSFVGGLFYGDGRNINVPYNQFISNSNQTAASSANAYTVTFDSATFSDNISLVSGTKITPVYTGVYSFQFSIQFQNTTNSTQSVDVWFRKNGVDIANSNSQFGLPPRKSSGGAAALIAVTPYAISLQANDYIELVWHVSDPGVSIAQYPAVAASPGVTPAIPATPSVILIVHFVSAS